MTFTIQHRQVLEVPSASGVVQVDNTLFVVGDNSAWLYQFNDQYEVIDKHLLMEGITDSILSKASKPDFEAMTSFQINNQKGILIFGSGSQSPERDVIARVSFNNGIHTKLYSADALFSALRNSSYLNAKSLNIEAAATIENTIYLFNREENLVIEYHLDELLGFLEGENKIPKYKIYQIQLPQLNGISAKFSGASEVPGQPQLVFTASVEDAPNTYDDGEVSGSYVGILHINELRDGYIPQCILVVNDSEPIAIKIESVEVIEKIGNQELKLVLVSDSDGGDSELLMGILKWWQ